MGLYINNIYCIVCGRESNLRQYLKTIETLIYGG